MEIDQHGWIKPVSMVSITHADAGTETESDENCMRHGAQTRVTPGGELHKPIGPGDKLRPERNMETRGNPLAISSGVKLHGETPTDRASTQLLPHTEEREETSGDQGDEEPSHSRLRA